MARKIRMGMVGGGEGSFIASIHRMAARLDDSIELVAGCFSRQHPKSIQMGQQLGLESARCYASYEQMFEAEAALPADKRIEFVSIVTPNHMHFPVAKAALLAGFNVLSDKPATTSLEQAIALQQLVQQQQLHYGLTHTYAAYPLVRQARQMIAQGKLGTVRRISVSYPQGWLADSADTQASAQASWRTDPERSGESGCFADIGTHAFHLLEYVSGLQVMEIAADLVTQVKDRLLDDDGAAMLRLTNGARATLMASQACTGLGNNLQISIYGDRASLYWQQEQPNQLWLQRRGEPQQLWTAGADCDYLDVAVRDLCRTPAGHPEGYIEAFANLYRDFALLVRNGEQLDDGLSIDAAVRGMAFIRAALLSSQNNASWVSVDPLALQKQID
ncbi:Gfo/Idh/MocA family oxidoreductase [Alkalimonas collagenimarina]|uniref:Gfo/Idh/MocA family oxidoreductase n=1 Tax=Alkalimonas collagenimarina TaxID=400390 RepID=A0ABT9H034_9GAMM|nr:Gfo/Idh/MocA family oxidoreductase [Alkalimonas collagenimarina]MDP4536675.1 Gfo/Idh/MocA family oxidoreductase [Alkalimonas collagenimarina]